MEERRQFLRVEGRLAVRYKVLPSPPHPAERRLTATRNLGGGGVCLVMPECLAPKTHLEVDLTLPGLPAPIRFTGQVIWCDAPGPGSVPGHRMGLQILLIDPEDHRALTRYCLKGPGSFRTSAEP